MGQLGKDKAGVAVKTAFIALMPCALGLYIVYKAGREIIKFLGV